MTRVFIGIKISPEFERNAVDWQARNPDLPMRWLQGKDLHVTLIPPWDESDVSRAAARLAEAAKGAVPPRIAFRHIDWGTTGFWPKLIWIAGESNPDVEALIGSLEREFGREAHKPFFPHVTVGRVRRGDEAREFRPVREEFEWEETAEEVTLFESLGGSEYARLADARL